MIAPPSSHLVVPNSKICQKVIDDHTLLPNIPHKEGDEARQGNTKMLSGTANLKSDLLNKMIAVHESEIGSIATSKKYGTLLILD